MPEEQLAYLGEAEEPQDDDRDVSNVILRAGYLRGLATRPGLPLDDQTVLLRASRSLVAYARHLHDALRMRRDAAEGRR